MKILTCNIRCFGAKDGKNSWVHRRGLCADVIRAQSPDIICFQEMWRQQFADLSAVFPGFETFAMVDEPVGGHPSNGIFYRRKAFTRASAGGYWLSKRPIVAGSRSWDSACVRLANWVWLEDRSTGREFRLVNTHLDHLGQAARENQARLLVEDAAAYPADYPQVLTGDMNVDTRNKAIHILKAGGWTDTYGAVHGTEDPGFTYHGFRGPDYEAESEKGKMDWIFTRGNVRVLDAAVIRDSRKGRFPSDHYFVSATVVVGGSKPPGKASRK